MTRIEAQKFAIRNGGERKCRCARSLECEACALQQEHRLSRWRCTITEGGIRRLWTANVFFYLVGTLKFGAAVMLLPSLWTPALAFPAASIVVVLMFVAVSMHIKVRDSIMKTVPAASMLFMSVAICSSL